MGAMPSFICLILVLSHWLLRIIITGNEKEELPEEAKDINLFGKIILALISMIVFIIIIVQDEVDGEIIKWFWMIFIILVLGFQSYLDWKYLKESKSYIVSIIVLIIGVGLVNFLL